METPSRAPAPSLFGNFLIYIYWGVIVLFLVFTFYLIGFAKRDVDLRNQNGANNVEITASAEASDNYLSDARNLLLSGDVHGAVENLTNAISAAPRNVDAYIYRGEAFMQLGNFTSALSDLNVAAELDPDNAVAFYDMALVNTKLEDWNAAIANVNDAFSANSRRPSGIVTLRDLYTKRAQLNLWGKNWVDAASDYSAALINSNDAENWEDYVGRAEAYTALSQYNLAISDYLSAVKIISERIQAADSDAQRESLSRSAMSAFEKSAAIHISLGELTEGRTDLESSYTIAAALGDHDQTDRLSGLIADIAQQQQGVWLGNE
ncbi:hypothetical protein FACS189421_11610 [Bacteroidia bacterium]|nr:hypothetical protein FACS189421_11610 [Bacteroidia bacterium]